jgi:hypothetical protein
MYFSFRVFTGIDDFSSLLSPTSDRLSTTYSQWTGLVPKGINLLYGNLSYQEYTSLGLEVMTSLSSALQTCPISNLTIFVPHIASTCAILEVATVVHPQYQESISSDLTYSFLEMAQPGSAPANDFDTRLEKKLEQLKHVEVDQSWYTGALENPSDFYSGIDSCSI